MGTHPALVEEQFYVKFYKKLGQYIHGHWFSKLYVSIIHKFKRMRELEELYREIRIEDKEIIFVEHHLSHATCTYYTRPWDEKTLVLTLEVKETVFHQQST